MEHGWGIAKVKEYDWFKKSLVSDEHGFPLVAVLDTNIVVSSTNIKLGEMMSIFQLVYKVRDEGKGVCITGSVFVEITIVLAGAELVILLFNDEEGGCLGRV